MIEERTLSSRRTDDAPWLGEIPDDWEVCPLRAKLRRSRHLVGEESSRYRLLSLTLRGVIERDLTEMKGKFPASFDTYQAVEPGDFVFCLFDVQETPRTVGLSLYPGMITGAYDIYKGRGGVSDRYLEKLLLSFDAVKALRPLYRGLRNTLPRSAFESMRICWPSADEQALIVRYLDNAELRIGRAIQAKQKMANLLREREQQDLIAAITGGAGALHFDPRVDWLPGIPAHWEVKRLGSVLEERGEQNTPARMHQVLSLLRKRGVMPYEEKGNIGNKKSDDISRYKIVRVNDIVVNCMNVIIGSVGLSSYDGCLSPVYYVLRTRNKDDSAGYFDALFQLESFHKSLVRFGRGILSHRMRISMLDLKTVLLPVPPPEEQAEIVDRVRLAKAATDAAIAAVEREIELLREYRVRLISDVVTGKRDVRAEAAGMEDVDPVELASVLAGSSTVNEDELGEGDDAE